METQNALPTTKSVGIRYGAIMGVIAVAVFLIMIVSDIDLNGPAKWVSYPIYIVMIVLAHKYFKDNGDGYMTFGQGVGIAFWMSLISSAISSLFTYIYVKFIDTNFIEAMKEKQIEQFEKQGMSDAQIDQAMKITAYFMNPEVFLIMGMVFGVIGIVITSLIVTAFTQKKNPQPVF
jgi:hypothetical protein